METLVPPANEERVADADITAAIDMLFLTKKGVISHLMDVATQEGIVELSGFTDNLLSRERAEEIALAVRGVRGVINDLIIRTSHVPDAELQRHVARALLDNPATGDYEVRGTVANGAVTLSGTVQSWAEKGLVLRVIQGVRGVHSIEAEALTIPGDTIQNSDEEITTQIRELLDWDIRVNSALVQVLTIDQVVYLAGLIGTAAEKARIAVIAYQAGASRVETHDLVVAHWALGRQLRRDKFAHRLDADIVRAVRDTFRYDPSVLSSEPLVQVRNGVVTLAGTINNLRAKQAAEQDARNVVGVRDVHNLLKVRTEHLSPDGDIRQTIVDALSRDPYVGHVEFSINVRNGQASLYGRVNDHFEAEQAGEVAAGVNCVVEVQNRVEVLGSTSLNRFSSLPQSAPALHRTAGPNPDYALAERIRMRYCWSASLHDQEVEVRAEDGRVTLTGTVDTWLDRKQAALDAYEVGARDVNNHLRVTTDPAPPARYL